MNTLNMPEMILQFLWFVFIFHFFYDVYLSWKVLIQFDSYDSNEETYVLAHLRFKGTIELFGLRFNLPLAIQLVYRKS